MTQCTAKSKRSGQQCKRAATPGYSVCSIHGGRTPRGSASPHYVNGRYSKALPERLAARYVEATQDSELLALRDEISLTDTLIVDTVEKLDTGGSKAHFLALRQKWDEFQRYEKQGDGPKTSAALWELGNLITDGLRDFTLLDDIARLIEQRRKLSESERKRLIEMRQLFTAEQAVLLLGAITDIIARNVTDRDTRARISREFTQLADSGRF